MTPTYETGADREREETVAIEWARVGGFDVPAEREQFAVIDRWLYRNGRHVGIFEIKTRENTMGQYDPYKVDYLKWDTLIREGEAHNVVGFLVVAWTDVTAWIIPTRRIEKTLKREPFQRRGRPEVTDGIKIPLALFTRRHA